MRMLYPHIYQLCGVGHPVAAIVVETHSPHSHEGFSIMMEVCRELVPLLHAVFAFESVDVVYGVLYVVGAHSAKVVHHCNGTPVGSRRAHGRIEDTVELSIACGTFYLAYEPLHEHSVDAVLAHPSEVGLHGFGVVGAESVGGRTVGHLELRFVELFVFAHVGPHVDVGRSGAETPVAALIVIPSAAAAVARSREPPLIARHHQSLV